MTQHNLDASRKSAGITVDREILVKQLMNKYCTYLVGLSNVDLAQIIEAEKFLFKETLE